jgi:cell shape-determining protein MreD
LEHTPREHPADHRFTASFVIRHSSFVIPKLSSDPRTRAPLMIFFPFLLIVLFFSFIVQQFLPPVPSIHAHIYLVPIFVFYSAVATPFWMMLIVAFLSGAMWDAFTAQMVESSVEIPIGWTIFIYATFGAIMSGFRPLFQRGRWDIFFVTSVLSGVFTSLIVLAEFVMISYRRGFFVFSKPIAWRIGGAGMAVALLAPAVFIVLNWVAELTKYNPYFNERRP